MSEQIGGAIASLDPGHILGADHSLALYHPFIQFVSRFILWIW